MQGLRFGLNVTRSELLTTSQGSAMQAQNWVQQNGNPYSRSAVDDFGNIFEYFGSKFTAFELSAGWYTQTLNRGLFPDRGQRQSLSLSSSIPGSAVEYFVPTTSFQQYIPIWQRLHRIAELPGQPTGRASAIPSVCRRTGSIFAGGPDTVRGFRESRLGPKDNFGNPYGGNALLVGRAEVILPMPAKWQIQRPGQPVLRHWQRVLDQ